MATQPFSFERVQPPSPARIAQIDISGPARALGVLRWSDYTLVVVCGLGALGTLPDVISAALHGQWGGFVIEALMVATGAFAAFTGWRHVGVIDPRVWRSYLLVFPVLAVMFGLVSLTAALQWASKGRVPLEDVQSMAGFWAGLWLTGIAVPGFVCVKRLRRMRIAPMGIPLSELLWGLTQRGGEDAPRVTRVERPQFRRGVFYAALGACVLLAMTFTPIPADNHKAAIAYKLIPQLSMLAFFLILRARRYFQVSADALLAVDKRPPILFLRSFTDDERQQYGNSQKALLDFSLETRLANHFYQFGPFIAVGSPKETVPQPGAARVLLADDEWQSRVLGWMETASLIVMYCGTTRWVNWELQKIIEKGRSTNLILMIPEVKGLRSKRRKDIAERIEQLREVFRNTEWNEELAEFNDFPGLRAMLFRADGSMVMVKSRSWSRDSYHLAALIAHQQLLDPMPAVDWAVPRAVERKRHPLLRAGAWVAGAAALLLVALIYIAGSNEPSKLDFKKGELYFARPVSEAEAGRVGQFLVDRHYFSDEKSATVRLDRNDTRYQLQFVINPSYADDLWMVTQLGVMGQDISRDVLEGKPLDVVLSDKDWKLIKTAPSSAKLTFGAGELYYTDPVTADLARAAGESLRKIGFFGNERKVSAHLGREQNVYQLRFVIDGSRANDDSIVRAFRTWTQAVAAQALGGESVLMHLCDTKFHTLRSERVDGR